MPLLVEKTVVIDTVTRSGTHRKDKCNDDTNVMEHDSNVAVKYEPAVKMSDHEYAMKKIAALKVSLGKDPNAADLKWSFFVAACNTYRYDTCLRPFPPMYIRNECKDIDALRKAIESIPPLIVVFHELGEPDVYENYGTAIELLYWVLIRLRDPHIKSVAKQNYGNVLRLAPVGASQLPTTSSSLSAVPQPNLIFQVTSSKQSVAEEKWKVIAEGHSTFYAYHGNRLENFHSIIHYGLQPTTCNSFSKGVYLSSELGVTLPYSPMGYGWGGSILGSGLSCVALCELIDHPDVTQGDTSEKIANTIAQPVVSESAPNKHYLVVNNEIVRIRYLLVYGHEERSARSSNRSGLLAWFKQHRLLSFVLGYVVLLASVGLMRNKKFGKMYSLLLQRTGQE